MSGDGWGELGGPTALTAITSASRRRHHRLPDGNTVFGALLTGANAVGLGLVALILTTGNADAAPPSAGLAATVPDLSPVEVQPARPGAIATAAAPGPPSPYAAHRRASAGADTATPQTAVPAPPGGGHEGDVRQHPGLPLTPRRAPLPDRACPSQGTGPAARNTRPKSSR